MLHSPVPEPAPTPAARAETGKSRDARERYAATAEARKAAHQVHAQRQAFSAISGLVFRATRNGIGGVWAKRADIVLDFVRDAYGVYEAIANGALPEDGDAAADLTAIEAGMPFARAQYWVTGTLMHDMASALLGVPTSPAKRGAGRDGAVLSPALWICQFEGVRFGVTWAPNDSCSGCSVYTESEDVRPAIRALARAVLAHYAGPAGVIVGTREGRTTFGPLRAEVRPVSDAEQQIVERTKKFLARGVARTILLHGGPGVGKTTRAVAVARQIHQDGRVVALHGSADMQAFQTAVALVVSGGASAILLDDFDRVSYTRQSDFLAALSSANGAVTVFATVNTTCTIDPALLRAGRVSEYLCVTPPTAEERLPVLLARCDPDMMEDVARLWRDTLRAITEGWSYAEMQELATRVAVLGCDPEDVAHECASIAAQRGLSNAQVAESFLTRAAGLS